MNLENTLLKRCNSKCELCSAGTSLSVYNVPPVKEVTANINHWRALSESMWSEFPAVQVMA